MCKVNEITQTSQHLSMALEAARMVIWDWDLLTDCVVWSGSKELFGLAPGSCPETYESAMARVHPSDIESVSLSLNQARVERHDYHQELRIFGFDKSIHWIEAKGRFFYNDQGQAVRMLGTVMEISDRKAREEQWRLLEHVVLNISDGVLITETNTSDPMGAAIVYVNPGFIKLTGYTLEELVGKTLYILLGEKTDQTILDKVRIAWQSGEPVQIEGINYTKDGREFWVEVRSFPIKDQTGRITHWVSVGRDITKRKQTEAALKENEQRFRQLAENIQDVFWMLDPFNHEIVYVSPVYERIWGRTCESLYANRMDWMNGIHPDDIEKVQLFLGEQVHKELFEHEYRIVHPDGTVRWIRDRGFPVKNELGQLKYITGIAQDITERKLAEAALQQLNEELEIRVQQRTLELERSQIILQQQLKREQLIKRLTQEIHQSLDLETILNTVVTEVQKLLASDRVLVHQIQSDGTGSIVAEAVVGDWARLLHQGFPEEIFPERSQQRDLEGQIYTLGDCENEEILPSFADFLAEIQVRAELMVPIIQEDTVWGLLIVHQCSEPREWQNWEIDLLKQLSSQVAIAIQQSELHQQLKEELRDRHKTEVALRRSETLFRSLSEFAPVGIYLSDFQGRNIYTNPRYQEITGCSTLKESLGYSWLKFVHPEDLQIVLESSTLVKAYQEVKSEIRFIHKDGTIRHCRMKSVPILSESGELASHVGIAEDITESLAIEKMKNEFISIVSHELKTPLAAIHGSLGLLASGRLQNKPETAQQMLEIAASDTKRLVRLVNEILDLERLESHKGTVVKQWCNAAQLMHQSVKTVQSLAADSKIKLIVLPNSVQFWADPDRIVQTLVNLVGNAIKFSPPKTTVTLGVEVVPNFVRFHVQDQGRGIPNDKLETIFGRFEQVDASDSRQKGGTGLGLAICRTITQQHGGTIWAESVLGKGSIFYFTIPSGS